MHATANGNPLTLKRQSDGIYIFEVKPEQLHTGVNLFGFGLDCDQLELQQHLIMKGDEKLSGAKQKPWRRLFKSANWPNDETIVDGSCRFSDSGTAVDEMTNMAYPLDARAARYVCCSFDMLLEETTAPDAAILRIANGEYVDHIQFDHNKITLKFANVSADFQTDDTFHHYDVMVAKDHLTVTADGEKLIDTTLTMKVNEKASLRENSKYTVPLMHERWMVIGSLSGTGTSVSRWKNITLQYDAMCITDVCLTEEFPE